MGLQASQVGSPAEQLGHIRLYGREAECAAIHALLEGALRSRSGVLVLRADAGVGKSALLSYARDHAGAMRVLQTIGVEPESDLPFAALHRLLRPVFEHIDALPEVQASALRSALGIGPGEVDNRFVIGLAVLSLLAELATEKPVLVLVDDAHWLDQSSGDVLAFVARRLEAEGIVMVFAAREHEGRRFPDPGLPVRRVNELDAAEAEDLLVDRFGSTLAPEPRRLIREAAQGNPLALLEIPEELTPAQRAGTERLPRPMPIGQDLEEVFLERVRRLPAPTQLLLLIAAAEGSGEAEVILAAGDRLGIPASALVDAETSGLIVADGATLRFRHPILRTVVYQGASLTQRQVAHRSLVETLSGRADEDRRAWHRAAMVLHVDDEVADELERTAERARRRSGHAGACAALRRAAELTSSVERRGSRLAAAARSAWEAGRPDDATPLLDEAGWEDDADVYAELRHVRGEISFRCGIPLEGAAVLMDGAARVAATNPPKALEMLFDAALCATYSGDPKVMLEAGRRASDLPISDSQAEAPFVELLTAVIALLEARNTRYVTRLVRALDRVTDATEPRWLIWAGAAAHGIGDEARDEAFLRRAEAIARRSMAVGTLAMVLERFSWKDMLNGRVSAASLHSGEGLQLAWDCGLTNSACFHRAILAWAAALRGDRDTCLLLAELALETATKNGLAAHHSIANWAVGLLHMGLGQWETATTRLERASSAGPGTSHPFVAVLALPDLVEASVRADRFDTARPAAMRLAKYVQGDGPDWAMALASRSRALISHAPEVKERLLSEALLFHDRDQQAFVRARTLLLLGEHLRRERRRAEARPHLRRALEVFEGLGASPWEKRARAELRATGEKTRRREPSTLTDLTPQQIQIARLVAEGATNKEVATRLFLSPRTVDYHLRNVFAKLDISSRTELIRLRLDEVPHDSS